MSKIRPRTPAKPENTLNKSLAISIVAVIISLSFLVLTWFNGCMSACSLKSFKWMTFKPRLWSWWKLKRGLGFLSLKNMTRTPWLNVTKEKNISEFFSFHFSRRRVAEPVRHDHSCTWKLIFPRPCMGHLSQNSCSPWETETAHKSYPK